MELSFSNKTCKINVKFYENMVELKERFILDKLPKDIEKHPCKYRKLKSGKVSCSYEFYIPNGFIYDALCINDGETKDKIIEWLKNLIDTIAKQRGIETPREDGV